MNKIKIITIGLLTVIGHACTADFEEINTNPNTTNVGQIQASGMFEPLLYNGANFWLNYTWYWNNELIQFTAFTGGTTRQEHRYFISDSNWQSVWNAYSRYGNNVSHLYDLSVEQEDRSLEAISLTLKVLYMSNLTDMFGDVPYSEAFTARKANGTTKPKFESQKEVYEQMFADLATANAIYATEPIFIKPALDGMYSGSMKKWQKFNNSLYLRLLMRVSGRNEMNVGAKMTEIINNPSTYPIFTSNADNATVVFSGNDPYRSQFADTNEGSFTSSGRKLTEQLIKMAVIKDGNGQETFVDPRLPIIGKKNPNLSVNPDNVWKGTVSGVPEQDQSDADRGSSWLNTAVLARVDAPGSFMDYAEVQFILAEAALRGLISGGESASKEYYENGVTASVEKWAEYGQYSETPVTVENADITALLKSDLASWDKASDKNELIGNQKYLALFWIGMEAYHEFRRTGYPELTIGAGTVFNDYTLPTRFVYPTTTLATNPDNVEEAIARMGGNTMKTPVWWSQQAIQGGN
ncbi:MULTISPECIES: SusD/RagB family nutrient-binding outer membrane lipoprotein [unclassified Arenibacter]|uniref:SusD/RagB family nutrient-binding outer membrane lipoprotein n=1 Tax=unclassified Arenibacter TaxID=2615047 RepID=UPI000E3552D2|nr:MULTISPECIES: SusD/RagB family nutrient-binding outer membrane lipoprotein [unclassified Arenibacter]MCM4162332.1 SusD/RagB family nutrient-binding outer membrane lipoprotein [Arenibacter sp. A80]RFT57930.1 SusD/RagB family nutrient-binding outer membrane lipoprotein [Arenibacter sp. P308M17]